MKTQKTFLGLNYKQILKRYYMCESIDGNLRGRTIFQAKGRLFECPVIFTEKSIILTNIFYKPVLEIVK